MLLSKAKIVQQDVAKVLSSREKLLNELRNDTIVITGGTGFVGTWLVELIAFLNDEYSYGIKMHLMARDCTKFRNACPHLASRNDLTLIPCDVRSLVEFPRGVTRIIHAAANPDSNHHLSNPLATLSTIATGTTQVLQSAMRCSSLKSILNISSGLVYGPQPSDVEAISESFLGVIDSNSVANSYAEAKRFAEAICAAFRSQYRLPAVNVRPFAFVGPYQRLDHPWAVNSFILDAIEGRPIRVLGDGKIVRSYLYGSDMAFWLLRMLAAGEAGETYNLGSSNPLEIHTMAEKIQSLVNPSPDIYYRVNPGAEWKKSNFVPDTTKAKTSLGLQETVMLNEALERTMSWFKSQA